MSRTLGVRVVVAAAVWAVASAAGAADPPTAKPQQVSLAVLGRLTPGWAAKLREGLKSLNGVTSVEVSSDEKRANVTFQPDVVTAQRISLAAREKSGVDVRLVRHATFDVKGMLNPNCPVLVRKALERMDGILGVRASLQEAKAWVEYAEGTATPAEMARLVKDRAGIEMQPVPNAP